MAQAPDFRALLVRVPGSGGRRFEALQAGPFTLHVQASAFHFCEPRRDGLRASEYQSFEVSIAENGVLFRPTDDPRFADVASQAEWAALKGRRSDSLAGAREVAGRLPAERAQALWARAWGLARTQEAAPRGEKQHNQGVGDTAASQRSNAGTEPER